MGYCRGGSRGDNVHDLISVVGAIIPFGTIEVIIQIFGGGDADDGEDEVDSQDDKLDDPQGNEVTLLPHFIVVGGRHDDESRWCC